MIRSHFPLRRNAIIYMTGLVITLASGSAVATDCYPEIVVLDSQIKIDNFQQHYGDGGICDTVTGYLSISGADINNLVGLSALTHVMGDFSLSGTSVLNSMSGLENLVYVGGSLEIHDNWALNSLEGMQNLTTVALWLYISSNNLTDLDGLSSLEVVGEGLTINDSIQNLNGLSALSSVGWLDLNYNWNLINVDGLLGLTSLNSLSIRNNNSLTNLNGLINLTSVVENVTIHWMEKLENIDGLAGLNYIGGSLEIDQAWLLTNIDGLKNLKEVAGEGNAEGIFINSNRDLININGLSGLTTLPSVLSVTNNPAVTDLTGLINLASVGQLGIGNNDSLINLDGLDNLKYIKVLLGLGGNDALIDIKGLSSLIQLDGWLSIRNNQSLPSLEGLDNLADVGEDVTIQGNAELSDCAALSSLIDSVDDPPPGPGPGVAGIPDVGGDVLIFDNQEGCNSISEITTIFSDGFEPGPNTITSIDATPPVGLHTFLAIGSDGYPIISFGDEFAGSLNLILCDRIKCDNALSTIATIDEQKTWVGWPSSIVVGQDGYPVIAYSGSISAWRPLLIAKCNDVRCLGGDEQISVADNPEIHVGFSSSIAIGADGFPVISHTTELEGVPSLRLTKCNDAACTGGNESSMTIQEGLGGGDTALAIGGDGFPIIATIDHVLDQIVVVKCDDPACVGNGEMISVVADDLGDNHLSMKLGLDGFPIIAYQGNLGPTLKVIKCNDLACAGNDETESVVDDVGEFPGAPVSIAIPDDGNPIIAYWDRVGELGQLAVASCNDVSCSGGDETITIVDGPSYVGQGVSLAIGSDGLPIMSYLDTETWPGSIKVLHCSVPDCNP